MRLKPILLCTLVACTSFFGGTWLGKNAANKPENVPILAEAQENKSILSDEKDIAPVSKQESPSPVPTVRPSTFFLVLSDKEISVYEMLPEGDAVFLYATGVEIDQLRQEDYEKLCRGMKVATLEEARALTEDFGS